MRKSKQRAEVHFIKEQQHLESQAKTFVFREMEKKGIKNSETGLKNLIKSDS